MLSGSDGKPVWFELPDEIIMRVKIKHPTIPEFETLGLQWYGLPAVSGMLMEIGGIQFPACPFSGWYGLSEIATRDLLDPHRYNLLHVRSCGLKLYVFFSVKRCHISFTLIRKLQWFWDMILLSPTIYGKTELTLS